MNNPSLKQVNLSATGQTANPLEPGWYPAIPNQGSPTFTPNGSAISLPAGYYGGGAVNPYKMAQGSVSSGSTTETFYLTSGSSVSAYPVTIPLPVSIANVIAIFANESSDEAILFATPFGYADGATANCIALSGYNLSETLFEAGGPLSLTNNSIVIPVVSADNVGTWNYLLFYT